MSKDKLFIALPDGHLMNHVVPFLKGTGIKLTGYDNERLLRCPIFGVDSDFAANLLKHHELISIKVVRPQDIPTHIANGNFDLGISGTDWLFEHQLRFPKSPIRELVKLGFGKVRIVAAVHKDRYKSDHDELIRSLSQSSKGRHIRIASEYVYIADNFAIRHNLHPYKIIMTYGATESLIPEDCDLIIENTETGNTLRLNQLEIINTIMQSEGNLIANTSSSDIAWKKELIDGIEELFRKKLADSGVF